MDARNEMPQCDHGLVIARPPTFLCTHRLERAHKLTEVQSREVATGLLEGELRPTVNREKTHQVHASQGVTRLANDWIKRFHRPFSYRTMQRTSCRSQFLHIKSAEKPTFDGIHVDVIYSSILNGGELFSLPEVSPTGIIKMTHFTCRFCLMKNLFLAFFIVAFLLPYTAMSAEKVTAKTSFSELVAEDQPVAYWRFNEAKDQTPQNTIEQGDTVAKSEIVGTIKGALPGPKPPHFPLFSGDNRAIAMIPGKNFLRVKDPGDNSYLDFDAGDSITMEAWINPASLSDGQHMYIVGKGRTNNPNFPRDNQNYALRLHGKRGAACLSFLFRAKENRPNHRDDFHRWYADEGFVVDGQWHHVAVTYTFGKSDSLHGYVDGREVPGTWDIGGATDKAPVVDNDELWIGSSIGGSPQTTFHGLIDELAIYRSALSAERIELRYEANVPDPREIEFADKRVPTDDVLVEVIEGPGAIATTLSTTGSAESYTQSHFAFVDVPKKYIDGLIHDRPNSFQVRARTKRVLPAGQYQVLLRAKSATRLYVDGRIVAQTKLLNRNGSGHEAVPELAKSKHEGIVELLAGHQETVATITLDDQPHVFRLEAMVGGKGLRQEIGEVAVAIARDGEEFRLLGAAGASDVVLDETSWLAHVKSLRDQVQQLESASRRRSSKLEDEYWAKRHEIAREVLAGQPEIRPPSVKDHLQVVNAIDQFIGRKLEAEGVEPLQPTDDYSFLRRASLDTVGVIPSREEIKQFLADAPDKRRSRAIDRLLDDPRWADHWVSYWQDVLAENPGILKPKLNNSGPFRWWIYESFLDNKAMDRFATELIMMRGSKYQGGPAGFAMATQNDVPMAAKAQVVSQAFLGLEMKCARCHDAPFHSFKQKELFHMAAMLDRKTISLPKTSTVPVSESQRELLVKVSIKPGDKLEPNWPLEIGSDALLDGMLRSTKDDRERLAAIVTSPRNVRFAKMMVNRLWARWMGRGVVEPIDDWEEKVPSHPELLEFLARELIENDYDLKHVARLILNSQTYQRQVLVDDTIDERLWAGQIRRRMSAEQIVDSMFVAAGKEFGSEMLTLDPEGRRSVETFLNLGAPTRSWQFTSLSNERDRPALALPMAQTFLDVLLAYGWRDSRPNGITVRDETPTMLQSLALANGVAAMRVTTLSDDNAMTRLSLEENTSVEQLVNRVFLQLLSRPAADDEIALFVDMLANGFGDRVANVAEVKPAPRRRGTNVSWSNHLSAEATRIKLELERAVRAGDPPTTRLQSDWRERMEDGIWALLNTPEFVFLP